MNSKMSIDEIRDVMSVLEHDAEALYRYNDPSESIKLLERMTIRDKKRLLFWAIQEGNKDILNVANYFIQKLNLISNDHEKYPLQMTEEDYYEIIEIRRQLHTYTGKKKVPSEIEQEYLIKVLSDACNKIGYLTVEKAYWILLPHNLSEDPEWIECSNEDASDECSFQVSYAPSKEERIRLFELMREASWVINLHNHPLLLLTESENLDFSFEDRSFIKYWETLRPELSYKMLWGVVQRNHVFGMPFTLPTHMTPNNSHKQINPNDVVEGSEEISSKKEASIIDAHNHYENLTIAQKRRLRRYIKDTKQGKSVVYRKLTQKEERRNKIVLWIIAIVVSCMIILFWLYVITKITMSLFL